MCLYPQTIKNKKYLKGGSKNELAWDPRLHWITAKCGICWECRRQKARDWSVRMQEELKTQGSAAFIGLSFSEEALDEIQNKYGTDRYNEAATKAVRFWLS